MRGKFARVEALSPRPEGIYRFAIRMKASVPMAVTVEALGVWEMFDVTTSWRQYDILIAEPEGDYIDLYPLSDDTLYIEKMQLTYGKELYEWRPAPEDDVEFEWARIALDEVTISNIRDITEYLEYYCLMPAGQIPAQPTTYPPPPPWRLEATMDDAYQATASVSSATDSITSAIVYAATFARATDGAAGVYRFTYDGTAWLLDGNAVTLRDYGVTTDGTPAAGDTIAVTLQINASMIMYRCAVTIYSDGYFKWSDVTHYTAFDMAKAALSTSTKYQTEVQQLLDSWSVKVRATTVSDETGETVQDLLGRIQVTESTVTSLIDEVRQNDDGLNERLTSLQTQTSREILNTFTEAKEYADEQFGGAKQYVVDAKSWQRFSADGIEQGKLGSPFKSVLNNEELGFYENDQKVAYINNNRLKITNGEIINSLVIGSFEFVSGENGLGIIFNGSGGVT